MRKCQLEILSKIHGFCKENNIKYFLVGGTLIGAIRHNGYIPWDDDIDIAMLREDYDKFINSFKAKGYYIASPQTIKNYYLPYAKVVDESTRLKENISSKIEIGINVDVFPFDNIPNDKKKAKKQYKKSRILYNLLTLKNLAPKNRSFGKSLIYYGGKTITTLLPYSLLMRMIERNARRYANEKSEFVSQVVYPLYKDRTTWPKTIFDSTIPHVFEGKKYEIPKGYDEMLKITYGDYMKLPPKEKQIAHHDFVAWKK